MNKYLIPLILLLVVFCRRKKTVNSDLNIGQGDYDLILTKDESIKTQTLADQVQPSTKPLVKSNPKNSKPLSREKHERVFDKKQIFHVQKPMVPMNDLKKQYTNDDILKAKTDKSKMFLKKAPFNKKSLIF